MSRAVMDRVARAMAQRLFLVQRRDVSRGHGGGGGGGGISIGSGIKIGSGIGGGGGDAGGDSKWHAVFAVFGTTGNVYECHVCASPSCTCPDFTGDGGGGGGGRGGGNGRGGGSGAAGAGKHICKHLLWVYLRVLGVSRDDPVLCQVALLQSELAGMLAAPTAAQRASLAAASVREAYVAATGGTRGTEEAAPAPARRQPTTNAASFTASADATTAAAAAAAAAHDVEEVTCPVCFDPIEAGPPSVYSHHV